MTSPKAPSVSTMRFQCMAMEIYLVKSRQERKASYSHWIGEKHFFHTFTHLPDGITTSFPVFYGMIWVELAVSQSGRLKRRKHLDLPNRPNVAK